MSTLLLKGRLTAGAGPCQAFASVDRGKFWLVGEVAGLPVGADIYVIGTLAESSVCGKEPTLVVAWGGAKLPLADNPDKVVARDIEVTATHSSRDPSPTFKLEGREQPLVFDNDKGLWRGKLRSFEVAGPLDVVFVSEATNKQRFEVAVTATDPANPAQAKTKTFSEIAHKGAVVVRGEMEV